MRIHVLIIISIFFLGGCGGTKKHRYYLQSTGKHHVLDYNDTRPITISIHGTLPPLIGNLLHIFDAPIGLLPACELNKKFILSRVLYLLDKADPEEFPLETNYSFGWTGYLTFSARRAAAQQLYEEIRHYKGPITLIGHSHGGNVALELARIAHQNDDTDFTIDRLILLACPIQEVTVGYASLPLFKKVISLYSEGDFTQIVDPQGTYAESRHFKQCCNVDIPLFSQRKLPYFANVVQARIVDMGCDLGHLDFIRPRFLLQLPTIITMLESKDSSSQLAINIPKNHCEKAYFVEHCARRKYRAKKWMRVEK